MKFFDNMRYKMQQWSYGRYGSDELSRALSILSLALLFLSFIPYCGFLVFLALATLIYSTFRTCSRNVGKRKLENEKYLRLTQPMRDRREQRRQIRNEKRYYVFFKCPKCRNLNRVPRGKGKIRVTCPKCGEKTIKTT